MPADRKSAILGADKAKRDSSPAVAGSEWRAKELTAWGWVCRLAKQGRSKRRPYRPN